MVAAYLLVNTFALRNIFTSVYLYWSYILPTFYYPLHWLECTKWRVKQLLVRKEVSFCRSHNKPFSLNRNVKPRHSARYCIFQYDFETATLSKIIDLLCHQPWITLLLLWMWLSSMFVLPKCILYDLMKHQME